MSWAARLHDGPGFEGTAHRRRCRCHAAGSAISGPTGIARRARAAGTARTAPRDGHVRAKCGPSMGRIRAEYGPIAGQVRPPCPPAAAARRQPQCRIGVHRAPPVRTAMSHGDSAASHHICASLHHHASRAGCRRAPHDAGRALRGGAAGPIRGDMARRLRKPVRANQWRFVRQYRLQTRPATGFMGNGVLRIGSRRDRVRRTPFFVWRMT